MTQPRIMSCLPSVSPPCLRHARLLFQYCLCNTNELPGHVKVQQQSSMIVNEYAAKCQTHKVRVSPSITVTGHTGHRVSDITHQQRLDLQPC